MPAQTAAVAYVHAHALQLRSYETVSTPSRSCSPGCSLNLCNGISNLCRARRYQRISMWHLQCLSDKTKERTILRDRC